MSVSESYVQSDQRDSAALGKYVYRAPTQEKNGTYLHMLPKDVLIKIMHIIQDNVKDENETLKNSLNNFEFIRHVAVCSKKDCSNIIVIKSLQKPIKKMGIPCDNCHNYYCTFHADEMISLKHKDSRLFDCGPVCDNNLCLEDYTHNDFNHIEEYEIMSYKDYRLSLLPDSTEVTLARNDPVELMEII